MPNSINGWTVLDSPPWNDSRLDTRPVPGVPTRRLKLRAEVLPLFLALAKDYHDTIAPIDEGELDDWSYSYRDARFSTSWSDHASGTAIDLNASKEGWLGMGNYAYWANPAKHKAAQAILARYKVVMWGGSTDFGGSYRNGPTVDWMHWAIKPGVTVAQVQAVIRELNITPDGVRHGVKPENSQALERLERQRRGWRRRRDQLKADGKTAGIAKARAKMRELTERIRALGGKG
jgi:hypothetical protein